jgi:hypothetical protein
VYDPRGFVGVFQDGLLDTPPPPRPTWVEHLAERFSMNGYRFVPLVTQDLALTCAVHILFLRPEPPGGIVRGGDIDNRIKTLFDGLKMPRLVQDLGDYAAPAANEVPFYCLVEDDALITSLSVETDALLEPVSDTPDAVDARLIITVRLRPARTTLENVAFA